MAEQDIQGIGVKFTAEASQLKTELANLETRLKAFNSAYGQMKVNLQASLTMPGDRKLQDFRRDVEKAFLPQGTAGPVKARIELLPPTAAQIKTLKSQIGANGSIPIDVIGNFKWGDNKPPKSVTVTVVEEYQPRGRRGAAGGAAVGGARGRGDEDEGAQLAAAAPRVGGGSRGRRGETAVVAPRLTAPSRQAKAAAERRAVGSRELFQDYTDTAPLIADWKDSLRKGGSLTWANKARDELVARGYKRNELDAVQNQIRGGGRRGGAAGFATAPPPARRGGGGRGYLGQGDVETAVRQEQAMRQRARAYVPPNPQAILEKFGGRRIESLGGGRGETLAASQADPQQFLNNLRAMVAMATPQARQEAPGWYPGAQGIAGRLGGALGHPMGTGSAMLASLSPRNRWRWNVADAYKIAAQQLGVEGPPGRTNALSGNVAKATGMAQTGQFEGLLSGPKVEPFHAQIMRPGRGMPPSGSPDLKAVIDTLMMQAGTLNTAIKAPGSVAITRAMQEAIAELSSELGMNTGAGQALPWIAGQEQLERLKNPKFAGGPLENLFSAAGGGRGFARPAWLGTPTSGRAMATMGGGLAPTGRPGVHIESPAASGQDRRAMYSVARNEEGKALGALWMKLRGGHNVTDIFPFVEERARNQGIGKALYAHAQRAGFDVEGLSDRNAAGFGVQTQFGEALWASRKRAMGLDPEQYRQEVYEREREREWEEYETRMGPGGRQRREEAHRAAQRRSPDRLVLDTTMPGQRFGGGRGFAAPAWLKGKPSGSGRSALGLMMDDIAPTGRPGHHRLDGPGQEVGGRIKPPGRRSRPPWPASR